MATNKLKKETEERLRKAADTRGAKSYAEWLGAGKSNTGDLLQAEAAKSARREAVGYGTSGETLARSGLADDGYASYLRHAAKTAREDTQRRIERERAGEQLSALGSYASYLENARKEKGDRLVSLGERLLSEGYDSDTAESLIGKEGAGDTAAAILRGIQRSGIPLEETPEGRQQTEKVLDRLLKSGMTYRSAYEYCRLLGYSDKMATRLARLADEERSDMSRELIELFGND